MPFRSGNRGVLLHYLNIDWNFRAFHGSFLSLPLLLMLSMIRGYLWMILLQYLVTKQAYLLIQLLITNLLRTIPLWLSILDYLARVLLSLSFIINKASLLSCFSSLLISSIPLWASTEEDITWLVEVKPNDPENQDLTGITIVTNNIPTIITDLITDYVCWSIRSLPS